MFISDGIIKVWEKTIYSEKEKQDIIKELGAEYKKLDQSLILYKIDCFERRYQILEGIYYALDGSILDSENFSEFPAEWYSISPGSIGERLFKKVCKTEKYKNN
jgi:hypothetical protein